MSEKFDCMMNKEKDHQGQNKLEGILFITLTLLLTPYLGLFLFHSKSPITGRSCYLQGMLRLFVDYAVIHP